MYGKDAAFWEGSESVVGLLAAEGLEVHGTVGVGADKLPNGVVNHGVLAGPNLHHLLRQVTASRRQ